MRFGTWTHGYVLKQAARRLPVRVGERRPRLLERQTRPGRTSHGANHLTGRGARRFVPGDDGSAQGRLERNSSVMRTYSAG
jgi:hypothetical protein